MGPGRRLYHKPCLACTICNKRLDSLTLLEHDQQPYCKSCHVKNFGTRDLRQANLPYREGSAPSPSPLPASPVRQNKFSIPPGPPRFTTSPPPTLPGPFSFSPPNPSYMDTPPISRQTPSPPPAVPSYIHDRSSSPYTGPPTPTNTGRGLGGLPRTIPLSSQLDNGPIGERPSHRPSQSLNTTPMMLSSVTLGRSNSSAIPGVAHSPLAPTATGTAVGAGGTTGTRYGMALNVTGTPTGSPARTWGGGTPTCPKCAKSVFFAEQVKAVGRTWHKACLRCTECGTSLDSTRLTENEGQPLCRRCYSKLHGPQGSGYALLGKAGG